jgi:glutamate dehydrogenase
MQRWALHALRDDLWRARRELVQHALAEAPGVPVAEAIERFAEARPDAMRRVDDFARMLSVEGAADLAGLTLAVRQLRALAD